jgi:hypothetical protein
LKPDGLDDDPAKDRTSVYTDLGKAATCGARKEGPGRPRMAPRDQARWLPHARPIDAGRVKILTRRGNDWTDKYPALAKALAALPADTAYLDGELCGVLPDGRTAFNLIQNANEHGDASLIFFAFDLLYLNGESLMALPAVDRKKRLEALLVDAPAGLRYHDHQIDHGPAFHRLACEHALEGIDTSTGCRSIASSWARLVDWMRPSTEKRPLGA